MERKTSTLIKHAHEGWQILDFLAERFTYQSRSEWQQEIESGRLLLNDISAALQTTLRAGDRLTYLMPDFPEPEVDPDYTVLFEDNHLLAINKPGRLPCHPAGRFFNNTLWALLRRQHNLENFSLINRLDRETSGVVLIAKHKQAAGHCYQQFSERNVAKRYLVLVEGTFPDAEVEVKGFIATHPTGFIRKKAKFHYTDTGLPENAKHCSTHFRLLRQTDSISLLEARPRTGRYHQIRATLNGLGYPVVGDKLYGVDENLFLRFHKELMDEQDWSRLRLRRQALHAAELRLVHPENNREIVFTAPMPEEFEELL
jgi:23S rRNA pseudouridine955/2504/2580 synthase/23S rRNA pseudouridine1911/1915/1917 synthase